MLAAFEGICASGRSFSLLSAPSSVPQLLLVTPPIPPPAVPAPVPPAGTRCILDRSCGRIFYPLGLVFPLGCFFFAFSRAVVVLSVTRVLPGTHAVPVGRGSS